MKPALGKAAPFDAATIQLNSHLTRTERGVLDSLVSPARIQAFLDTLPYSEDHFYRSPLRVLHERKAHCFDGALFAAMALRRLGYPPKILELLPNERDDDHLVALFRQGGCWGAVAQSNFPGLRFREPIHRSLHELAMSYFEDFFNTAGEKTLRGYRGPVNLRRYDNLSWMEGDSGLEQLSESLDLYPITTLITEDLARDLEPLDERSLRAGLTGTNPAGLFKVPKGRRRKSEQGT
jgi:hypothetical protein